MESAVGTPPAGTPLFAAAREGHGMVIAPTGKGKTRNALIPHLLWYPGSTVVIDVKGELTNVTANRRRKMGQTVHVLDPFGITSEPSGSFNPFDLLGVAGSETPIEQLAMELPSMMHGTQGGSLPDPFWDIRADGLLAGVAGAAEAAFGADERNVVKMREMLMGDDSTYSLAVLLDTKKKQLPHLSYQQIASHLQTEDRCRSSILATATQHFGYTYGVEKCLTETSIDLEGLRAGKPVTVYLVIPARRLHSHGNLLRYWVSGLLSLLLSRTRAPKRETLFLIDEAAQLGELEQLRTALTLMRGYGVRTFSFWQDLAQLKRLYRDWQTLLNNCGSIQIFGANNYLAATMLARLTGKHASADDILCLPADEQLVVDCGRVRRMKKPDYLRDEIYSGLYDRNPAYDYETDDDEPEPSLPGLSA